MRIVFFGTPEFATASLDAIVASDHDVAAVVTIPDKPAGRGQKILFSDVKQYALDHALPLLQPQRLRDADFLDQLRSYQADLFVVVAFRMLPEAVWAMPRLGTINLHASLLPHYRGAAPINWAIINGEHTTGVSTFLLNHNIDEGDLLMQASTPIAPDETAGTLHDRLALIGKHLVVRTLDALDAGTITPTRQTGTPCPAPKIFKDDCLIDFGHTSLQVDRFVRGLAPYPSAIMRLRSPKGESVPFKVCAVSPIVEPHSHPIGTLLCDGKHHLKIATTDGYVEILELQMAGKRKNNIADFLRGNQLNGWLLDQSQTT